MGDTAVALSILMSGLSLGVLFSTTSGLASLGGYGGLISAILQYGAVGILAGVLFYLIHQNRRDHKEEKETIRKEKDLAMKEVHEFYQRIIDRKGKDHREEMAGAAQIAIKNFAQISGDVEKFREYLREELTDFRNESRAALAALVSQVGSICKGAGPTEVVRETQMEPKRGR